MRKLLIVLTLFAALSLGMAGTADDAKAETGLAGDLALGGHFGIGGITKYWSAFGWSGSGAFALAISPQLMYFPINNLAIYTKLPFYEAYLYDGGTIHMFPFMAGVRYYFNVPSIKALRPFVGGGLGASVLVFDKAIGGDDTRGRFALGANGGIQFEVIPHLGIEGSFDILLPNLAPRESGEKVTARFLIMSGVFYYLPL